MEENKKNIANTMEIDKILEEARNRASNNAQTKKNNASDNVQPKQNVTQSTVTKAEQLNDDFVIYDEDEPQPKQKNPKKKKTAILISVIVGVLVLVLAGGYCAYTMLGDFEYASNIYVNDIALGGLSEEEALELLQAEEQELADSINIVVQAEEKTSTVTKDDLTYTFTTEQVLKEAKQYTEDTLVPTGEKRYTIAVKIDDECAEQVAEKVSADINQDAESAVVTAFDSSKKGNDRFTVEESKTGMALKTSEFVAQFKDFLSTGNVNGTINAVVEIVEPEYTKEYLLTNIKMLSSFTTTSTNNANGNSNMKLSLSQCNNSIINPGEVWSFNGCTGDSNLTSNGYKPASVIVNGKYETGIGGGICQSSTTIYNATMLCGMEVVERQCHYYQSSYVDAGRDATVDYGNIDLKVKNIFDYQLFMECYMEGTKLYCNMYGLENPEFDEIKITSSVTSSFSNGFKAEASRTYYLDGKKVKTESLPNSTYYTSAPSSSSSSSSSTTSKPTTSSTTSSATEAPTSQAPTSAATEAPNSGTVTPDPEPTPEPTSAPEPAPDTPADAAAE